MTYTKLPPPPVTAAPRDRPREPRDVPPAPPDFVLECPECGDTEPAPVGWDPSMDVRCTECGGAMVEST